MDAVLGTAGHIDHGKTSLVRALTGINCDRLDEEKRRGITIELGFAWIDLPDGRRLGIVDVPGHERFVKAMVAGASGIDCMMLVIAADEGVMPQTREHLDICTLLGVHSGIVAITKTDMVDKDWLEMVKEDIAGNLAGTFLEKAPILPVSSATGQGLAELRMAIFELVASLKTQKRTDIMRLPVDRVFTLKGHGTVVTGTLVSGNCIQGEEICLMPSGKPGRARSLQVHSQPVTEAHQGQRCAINLQGLEVSEVERGDVVVHPGTLFASRRWIARLTCLQSSPLPLRQRMEAHFHHGAKECTARIVFRDRDELTPGKTAIAEIHFSLPLAGVFGDRCVLRAYSPLRTVAGAILLDPLPAILRKRDPLFAEKFAIYQKLAQLAILPLDAAEVRELTKLALALRSAPGASEKQMAVLTGLRSPELHKALQNLAERGLVICWDKTSKVWIDKKIFDVNVEKCLQRAEELHKREPLKTAFAQNALCSGWSDGLPPKFMQSVIDAAVAKDLLQVEGNGLKLATHRINLDADQATLFKKLKQIFGQNQFTPPFLRELSEQLHIEAKKLLPVLTHLCATNELIKIQDGVYYSKFTLDQILEKVRKWFGSHDSLDVSDMKTIFDISRKYAIPILEYMDSIHMTYRLENKRKLNSQFARKD